MKYSWKAPMHVRLRLWWHRLWIREDEFHASLDMDADAMRYMNTEQVHAYTQDLMKRRQAAHNAGIDDGHS